MCHFKSMGNELSLQKCVIKPFGDKNRKLQFLVSLFLFRWPHNLNFSTHHSKGIHISKDVKFQKHNQNTEVSKCYVICMLGNKLSYTNSQHSQMWKPCLHRIRKKLHRKQWQSGKKRLKLYPDRGKSTYRTLTDL